MKKITSFFLALLPIFVVILLFATGMLIKDYTHVFVTAVELNEASWSEQAPDLSLDQTHQLVANVLPFNATNPEIYYLSTDEDVVTVDQTGLVTYEGYGEASIYAISKENQNISAKCDFEIWDTQMHDIKCDEFMPEYVGFNQTFNLNATPYPSTHLDGDSSFTYTSKDESIITVSPDGEVKAKEKEGSTQITIHNDNWDVTKTVDVNVHVGVNAIEFKNPNNLTVQDRQYTLYDEILTYPEKKENVPASDFEFVSNNPDIAKVDSQGVVTFFKPEPATIDVKYKRKSLALSKTITSSCNSFSDILFNRYSYSASITDYPSESPYIDPSIINWHIYPEPEESSSLDDKIEISSSNPNVVAIEKVDNQTKLKVVGTGTTILSAKILYYNDTLMDVCQVIINSDEQSFIKEPIVDVNDNFCYYLRNNIHVEKLTDPHQTIQWTIDKPDIAYVDKYDIIHFKHAEPDGVTITANVAGKTTGESFVVRCQQITTKTINISNSCIKLKVGERYHFEDSYGYEWYPSNTSNFDEITSGAYTYYIPKAGCHITDFEFYSEGALPEYLNKELIVTQAPLGMWYDPNKMVYATAKTTIQLDDVFSVLPSTATDENGQPYKLHVTYEEQKPGTVTITDNAISFNEPGYVHAKASYHGLQNRDFFVKSTCGATGKFDLRTEEGKIVQSGEELILNPQEQKVFYVNDIFANHVEVSQSLLDQFTIKSKNDSDVIESSKEIVIDGSGNSFIKFTITAKQNTYGDDVIVIESANFKFYLNLTITSKVHDYDLLFMGNKIDSTNSIVTYINKLKLDIIPNPIALVDSAIPTVTLNSQQITVDNFRIDLTNKLVYGPNNRLVLRSSDGFEKIININLKDVTDINSFSVLEAEGQTNDVYIECGGTQKTLTLDVNGIIDDEFFNENFAIDFNPKQTEKAMQRNGKVYLTSLPSPDDNQPGYENTITIRLNKAVQPIENTYSLHRETVSRIVFPKHDNNNPDDQKGLQKVHVYGTESQYSPEEGKVNYYKLPFQLYDYKGELITDENDKKQQAFETLVSSITEGSGVKYHAPDTYNAESFLEITFASESIYTREEIDQNMFADPARSHNVTYSLSTHASFAEARYTFVPFSGRNIYCQEGMSNWANLILQTNFGLEGVTTDNVPFTRDDISNLHVLIGNGYTINFNERSKIQEERVSFCVDAVINTTIQGCNDDILDKSTLCVQNNADDGRPGIYSYDTFKNIPYGLQVYQKAETSVRNCLFFNNTITSINVSASGIPTTAHIENCVLFRCSSLAMNVTVDANVYFKGFIDVYNFKNRDLLKNIMGYDLQFMWDTLIPVARSKHMVQIGADGREYINSYMATVLSGNIYFWDPITQEYKISDKGNPGAANHLQQYFDLSIPIVGSVTLWGTPTPDYELGSPSYYDEFDGEGRLRWDFLNNQIDKLSREVNIWWL